LDEQGHNVKFGNQQWKIVKGNLVMARRRKRGSLYMFGLLSEGVTVPVRNINKVRFTESRGQKRVVFTREKPRATYQIQDERAWEGSVRPVRGIIAVGAWVVLQLMFLDDNGLGEPEFQLLKHLQKILVSMEYVCSQAIPRSDSSYKWKPVGTEDGSIAVSGMTNVLKIMGVSTKSSR